MGAASNGSFVGVDALAAADAGTARERCATAAVGAGSAPGARLVRRCIDGSAETTGSSRATTAGALVGRGGGRTGSGAASYPSHSPDSVTEPATLRRTRGSLIIAGPSLRV